MKCEKCGKNMANCHYISNINGKVTEQHLCSQCAAELDEKENVFAGAERSFNEMWNSFFAPRSSRRFPSFGFSVPDSFFDFQPFGLPLFRLTETPEKDAENAPAKTEETSGVDPEMARQRELNVLRAKMKEAVAAEEFETAAKLRDQIRAMEK